MGRSWIIAWVTVLVLLVVVGCARGTGEIPPEQAGPPVTAASTGAREVQELTIGPSPDERTAYDPPARSPQKQAGLFFPRVSEPGGMYPSALGGGTLIVKDRCIYMAPSGGGGVVVWPYGYSLRREDGEIVVLNGRDEVVAKVGDEVRMGGGQITKEEAGLTPEAARRAFEEQRGELGVPDRCRGPLWVSSGVVGR